VQRTALPARGFAGVSGRCNLTPVSPVHPLTITKFDKRKGNNNNLANGVAGHKTDYVVGQKENLFKRQFDLFSRHLFLGVSMEVRMIEFKGKKILYVDYRGAVNEDDMLANLKKEIEIERTLKEKTLLLSNFQDTYVSPNYMNEVNKTGKEIRTKIISKTALVGIQGVKSILLRSYITFTGQKDMKTFDTEELAKEWLIS